jgi:2-polyprenyl-3-methyl-5-hydroxy-6-metoxy-1,4-benzoquinol methylase
MNDIESYIQNNLSLEEFSFQRKKNFQDIKEYYDNAKADAIFCYGTIKKFLNSEKKILEVGGGIHLLTSFLSQNYNVTSIEPGGFTGFTDELRSKIINKNKLNVHTTTLENLNTKDKFDFIFSMNVLEHTQDISSHLETCVKYLKDKNSVIFMQCPNYSFPFEPHFYEFFVPFFPKFTFKYLRKKSLIKQLGKEKYNNILNNLNFDCTYFKLKRLNLPITFTHPLKDIFDRLDSDLEFKKRLFSNNLIKISYNLIKFLKIKSLLIAIFPKFLCPYLIIKLKK